jgi:diadenylate cyclase
VIWQFLQDHWRDGLEILIIAIAIYQLYRVFRATRGARILVGFAVLLVGLTLLSQVVKFEVIGWIITRATLLLAISAVVIFQPELRTRWPRSARAASSCSPTTASSRSSKPSPTPCSSSRRPASARCSRSSARSACAPTSTPGWCSTPSSRASWRRRSSTPNPAPRRRHDHRPRPGAGAACVFPVSQKELSDRSIGLRHRAAIGISEETDCVAVVVSEETAGFRFASTAN